MKIEYLCFSPEEAAKESSMAQRIEKISDSFLVAADETETILGYVVGPIIDERYLYDELFEKTESNKPVGGYQTILSLSVSPDYRKCGVASYLLEKLSEISKQNKRKGITLTCLKNLIPFYERCGYKVEKISDSHHANEIWFDMVLDL